MKVSPSRRYYASLPIYSPTEMSIDPMPNIQ